MHVRADIIEAFETDIGAVPIVAGVYDFVSVQAPPNPPKNKVTVELFLADEGKNKRIDGGYLPREAVLDRPAEMSVRVTGAVPRDMSGKDFERNVIAPIERAVALSSALEPLCNSWILAGIELQPALDGGTETLSAIMTWELTYSTLAADPGKAL